MILVLFSTLMAAIVSAGDAPRSSVRPAWAAELLRARLGLSDAELVRLGRGESVVRMVRNPGARELAVLGVTALAPGARAWRADFAGLERLRSSNPDLFGMGRLSVPPSLDELQAVALEARQLSAIRRCQPSRCVLNLPADAIEKLRHDTDSEVTFRRMLLVIAEHYQQEGDPSLPVLANRPYPVSTADATAALLSRPPSLAQIAPRLEAHFRDWPGSHATDMGDVFFWLREKSWKHEVVSLVHAAFDEEAVGSGRVQLLAEKTFYANHYFRGAVALTGVIEDAAGSYLFYLSRSETDNGSPFNFIERALAGYLIPHRLSRRIVELRERLLAQQEAELGR